jgi:endonuclease-3
MAALNKGLRSEAEVRALFSRWAKAQPEPASELTYQTPFQLLVAVVLSAQATDRSVNRATPALFAAAPGPQEMAALGASGIAPYIRHIGLYHTKARHVAALSTQLVEQHNGELPASRQALEALPGVGHKTASVILNIIFGQPTIAVDTHIFRVAHRLRLAKGKTPLAVEKQLVVAVPEPFRQQAHHWLILHGRYTCTARSPHCSDCIVADLCDGQPQTPAVNG